MFSLFIWTWCTFATDLSFTLLEWDWYSLLFVLTCRLTENYRKIRRSCNSKWRCVFLTVLQCLLVQTFSISLSSSGLLVSSGTIWYVIYETRKTVFDHNYKHREDSANDYMKDNMFQLRKKISRVDMIDHRSYAHTTWAVCKIKACHFWRTSGCLCDKIRYLNTVTIMIFFIWTWYIINQFENNKRTVNEALSRLLHNQDLFNDSQFHLSSIRLLDFLLWSTTSEVQH